MRGELKMKYKPKLIAISLAVALVFATAGGLSVYAKADWRSLFDGNGLDNWNVLGSANWHLEADTVSADTGSGFLVSKDSWQDFQLYLEFWVDADANSGVFFRCANPRDIKDTNCYEANIFDKRPDPQYRTGGIVNIAKPALNMDAGGKWNILLITAVGPRLQVELNGSVTVDVDDTKLDAGPIALQYGKGIVKFRNVRIMPL